MKLAQFPPDGSGGFSRLRRCFRTKRSRWQMAGGYWEFSETFFWKVPDSRKRVFEKSTIGIEISIFDLQKSMKPGKDVSENPLLVKSWDDYFLENFNVGNETQQLLGTYYRLTKARVYLGANLSLKELNLNRIKLSLKYTGLYFTLKALVLKMNSFLIRKLKSSYK